MKQPISKFLLSFGILLIISHCKKKTEVIEPEKIPYDCVLKSNGTNIFEYDAMGRILELKYHHPGYNFIENQRYTYQNNLVIVDSKQLSFGDTFTVQTTYYLNTKNLADSAVHISYRNQKYSHKYKDIYQLDDSGYVKEYVQVYSDNTTVSDTTYHSINKIENGNIVYCNVLKGSQAPYFTKTKYLDSLNTIELFEKINFTKSNKNLIYYSEISLGLSLKSVRKYVWDKFGRVEQIIHLSSQAHGKPPLESEPKYITWDCKFK